MDDPSPTKPFAFTKAAEEAGMRFFSEYLSKKYGGKWEITKAVSPSLEADDPTPPPYKA